MKRFSHLLGLKVALLGVCLALASLVTLAARPHLQPQPTVTSAPRRVAQQTRTPLPTSVSTPTPIPAVTVGTGMAFFSAERKGRWELYVAPVETRSGDAELGPWQQLTRDYSPARASALSPDGTRLAFQSRKDGNWEVYSLNLASGEVTRLTRDLAYDGAPSWSPDGKQLVFESYREGDLDIWRMNADGSEQVNLTPNEPTYDYGPVWSPDGEWIAFVSWRTGRKQIFVITPDGDDVTNISQSEYHDEQPAWSPDSRRLAFVSNREACTREIESTDPPPPGSALSNNCQRRAIYTADFSNLKLVNVRQITFSGRDLSPAWLPNGRAIAFISPRLDRQPLYVVPADGGLPDALLADKSWLGTAVMSRITQVQAASAPADYPPLVVEQPIPASPQEGHPYKFRAMREIYLAPSWGLLGSQVATSLLELKERTKQESGVDFLARVSDMTRLLSSPCDETCDSLSWHKAGRAVDTLLELYLDGRNVVRLVRQDQLGETYWRVYLRATVQNGTMGEPLKDPPWDLTVRARRDIAPGQGGIEGPIEYGYFVDFTELARMYGWKRISSHDDPEFDWRNNREALEFWHFQQTDGLTWYEAMQEVYSPAELTESINWDRVLKGWDEKPSRLFAKRVPPAPSAWKWYALIAQ